MPAAIELLDKWKKARSLASDNAASAALHVTRQAVSGWRTGATRPEAHTVERMCADLGEPVGAWLARIESERARSEADRRVWAKLARELGAAAVLAVAALTPYHASAAASNAMRHIDGTSYTLRALARAFRAAVRHRIARGVAAVGWSPVFNA